MPVTMGFTDRIIRAVLMLVMGIVNMAMLVIDRVMLVLVLVRLRQVQVETDSHEDASANQPGRHVFVEHCNAQRRTDERGGREVCACSRRPQMTQPEHE